jgi:ribose/xylose/arabinose/galactoside ABC-type transport system permease subunit
MTFVVLVGGIDLSVGSVVIASAAAAGVSRRRIRRACGSARWSIVRTDHPSSATQMVRSGICAAANAQRRASRGAQRETTWEARGEIRFRIHAGITWL